MVFGAWFCRFRFIFRFGRYLYRGAGGSGFVERASAFLAVDGVLYFYV